MSVLLAAESAPSAESRITALRSLLAEKFPVAPTRHHGVLPTGWEAMDAESGGLYRGKVTEITGSLSVGTLCLEMLLNILGRENCFAALIDPSHSFSPEDYRPHLDRLLWVLCTGSKQAIQAADLLLRDGNLSLLILDLQMLSLRELRSIPASTWHRFQRVTEQCNMVFAVLSSQPIVEGASMRIAVKSRWNLQAMRQPRAELMPQLSVQVFNRVPIDSADSIPLRRPA